MSRFIQLLIFILCLCASFSSSAQVYEKGDFIIDGYYGFPNILTSALRRGLDNRSEFKEVNISSIGPVGGKLEYLISDRVGLGLNINYANTGVSGVLQNPNGNTYTYSASISRFRVLPTLSVHMGSSERLDPYFAFSLGYFNLNFKDSSNDPSYKGIDEYAEGFGRFLVNPIPVAARIEFGLRYFFTDNIGINGQIGLGGGPPLAAGISLKF